jgi:flagellar M-ring protein FliF
MALVKADEVATQFTGFSGLPMLRQLGLMIGLAASVAIGVAVVMWAQTPNYRLLYSSVDGDELAQIVDTLQKSGINHKIDEGSGGVWIQGDQMHDARLKLANQGLTGGGSEGYKLMDKDQGFGGSQFMEKVRYQRALEAELARTITTINNVKSARVHLAMPKQSVFVRNRQKPSASVVVSLLAGRTLQEHQTQSIINLVSSSIPNLDPKHVTVVDQAGHLLSGDQSDDAMTFSSKQLEYKKKLEDSYAKRVEKILSPIVGIGGVNAQVNAELDFTTTEQTQESYNPDLAVVRSEQILEEGAKAALAATGVPGSLSNEPPQAGQIGNNAAPAVPSQGNSNSANMRKRAVRNYEIDKTISHTTINAGTVRRLSVAVLIDDKKTVEGGEVTRTPFTDKEIETFNALIKEAIGFNGQRGDTVQISNVSFSKPEVPEALPEPSLLEQPWVMDVGKQAVGAIAVLLLIFGVLKPVLRELAAKGVQSKDLMVQQAAQLAGNGQVVLDQNDVQRQVDNAAASAYESSMTTVKTMVAQDPRRVAQVVKTWVGEED